MESPPPSQNSWSHYHDKRFTFLQHTWSSAPAGGSLNGSSSSRRRSWVSPLKERVIMIHVRQSSDPWGSLQLNCSSWSTSSDMMLLISCQTTARRTEIVAGAAVIGRVSRLKERVMGFVVVVLDVVCILKIVWGRG